MDPALKIATPFVAKWEGFRPSTYNDIVGVETVGYGFTPHLPSRLWASIKGDIPLTEQQGRTYLQRVLGELYLPDVKDMTGLTAAHKLAAYTSWAYNVGVPAARDSTLVRRLQEGREDEAEEELMRWVHAGGNVVEGLVARRRSEKHLAEWDERLSPEDFGVEPMSACGVEEIETDAAKGWGEYIASKVQSVDLAT